MKKLFFVSMLLTAAMAAQAQMGTKIAPKMAKGTEKVYVTKSVSTIPGQKEINITAETKYTVVDATADGYLIDAIVTSFESDVTSDNVAGKILTASEELMKGLKIRLATNKDGKVEKIANYEELKPQIESMSNQLVEKMLEAVPQLSQMMSKDVLKTQVTESINEESLVKSMQSATSVLTLNGKTLMTGAQEEYINEMGVKMKRMYFVNGKNITTNSSMDMSKDDLKKLVIAQVEKMAPEQASVVKENIDAVMDSGMIKIDVKETATYELADDNWVKSIKAEVNNETMGQKMTVATTVTLK